MAKFVVDCPTYAVPELRAALQRLNLRPYYLETDQADVAACMNSVPECANNGCQFRKTDGYSKGKGPVFGA